MILQIEKASHQLKVTDKNPTGINLKLALQLPSMFWEIVLQLCKKIILSECPIVTVYRCFFQMDSPDVSLNSPVAVDSFVLPPSIRGAGKAILPSTQSDFAPSLPGLSPLSLPNLPNPMASAISMVTAQAINNIATSIQNLPAAAERSSSRSSYSPAMSDSGISVDTGSNGSGSALSKLGTLNVNEQGEILDQTLKIRSFSHTYSCICNPLPQLVRYADFIFIY